MKSVSIVVPVYYNEKTLADLFEKLKGIASLRKEISFEYIFVDDGSGDGSFAVLKELAGRSSSVRILKLSKNFGSFVACLAGFTYARGDCALIMSADMQEPPELVLQLLDEWMKGNEVVIAARRSRDESFAKVMLASFYYRLFKLVGNKDMPLEGFDIALIDRKVIDIIKDIKEKNTTLMGLILWVGFKRSIVYYDRVASKGGKSRWTFMKKLKYFTDSFIAFSFVPIHIMSVAGMVLAFAGFISIIIVLLDKLFFGIPVAGWTSLMVLILFFSGVQLLSLGVLGEYIWRNFDETRKRPVFIVQEKIGFASLPVADE